MQHHLWNIPKQMSKLAHLMFINLTFILLMTPAAHASASAKDVTTIAELCTNIHRAVKDYALIGMNVRYGNAQQDLDITLENINKEFEDLESGHHLGKEIDNILIAKHEQWKKINADLLLAPNQAKLANLLKDVETLAKDCWKIAELIASETHIDGEHFVIISAELGADVQRLASFYVAKSWGVTIDDYDGIVIMILDDFESIHHDLVTDAYPKYVNDEIKSDLDKAEKTFLVFEHMAINKSGRFVPSLASRSSSQLYTALNNITNKIQQRVEQ